MTQLALAKKLGISPSFLCKIEKSIQPPSEKLVMRCAQIFGVTRSELFPENSKDHTRIFEYKRNLNPVWIERTKLGLKQNDLAKKLKCSPSYLSKVENGQIQPTDFFVNQCMHFFQMKKSDLFPKIDSDD